MNIEFFPQVNKNIHEDIHREKRKENEIFLLSTEVIHISTGLIIIINI